mmetsp:Transcript_29434/g.42992  ORF Transcript_29434/g.42992 Transcript_29434/m.42992 type:complete len:98 (+) Transcript_29434:113-406(+)
MSKSEIEVTPMSKEEAEQKHGISSWGTWGCGVSKFDWEYSGKESAYVIRGKVLVTPTGEWASCKPTVVKAGDFAVFPDGMTCTWDVTEAIEKHYNFD